MQWPRMSVWGFSIADSMRRVMAGPPWTAWSARWPRPGRAGEQLFVLVQGTVLEDVDLDAGQDPKRRELFVQRRDHLQLGTQAVGVQSVGDGEPGTVVGEGQVIVAERGGGLGHLGDGAAAVGPVRMAVTVPLEDLAYAAAPAPSSGSGLFSSSCRYPGMRPASASVITWWDFSPTPGRSWTRPAATSALSWSGSTDDAAAAACRNALTR